MRAKISLDLTEEVLDLLDLSEDIECLGFGGHDCLNIYEFLYYE